MNIVSVTVTAAIMGVIAPGVAQMSIMPVIAQKRASNFGVAEARAVAYSALNEGAPALTPWKDNPATEGCEITDMGDDAHTIQCTYPYSGGDEPVMYPQTVSRSFRLAPLQGGNGGLQVNKNYTPGVFCPLWDAWGIDQYNKAHNVVCIPVPYGPWASTYTGKMLW